MCVRYITSGISAHINLAVIEPSGNKPSLWKSIIVLEVLSSVKGFDLSVKFLKVEAL